MKENATSPTLQTPSQNVGEESCCQELLCFSIAAVLLSEALLFSQGVFDFSALYIISVSFMLCVFAETKFKFSWSKERVQLAVYVILWGGVIVQLLQLLIQPPLVQLLSQRPRINIPLTHFSYLLYVLGLIFALILTIASTVKRPWVVRFRFPALLLVHASLGIWAIHHYPNPGIDVFVIQRDAVHALMDGTNPYTITFPNIYGDNTPYYRDDLTINGRFMFGYVYPPLCLLMAIPGHLLGDVRYSNLIAIVLSGALLAYARPSKLSFLSATLFLFMPSAFYVLVQCWTDSFVVLLFCLVLFIACRKPSLSFIPFGLLLAVKQHLFLCSPLALLLLSLRRHSKNFWSFLGRAALIAIAVSLPLILWNPRAFIEYAVLLNFGQPFLPDSLNYAALWARLIGTPPSPFIGFLVLIPTYIFVLRRSPTTPAGFAGSVALLYFAFFLFGRQAFINYYYFIFAALCGAIATTELSDAKEPIEPNTIRIAEDS